MKLKLKKGLSKAVASAPKEGAVAGQSTQTDSGGAAAMAVMAAPAKKKRAVRRKTAGKKMTRQERAKMRLNKMVNEYKGDQLKYNSFVTRLEKWFTDNKAKLIGLFTTFDRDGDGQLSYAEFKAGMLDMNIPCNLIELHLLCTLLDVDGDEQIDYEEFGKGIKHFREVEKGDDDDEDIQLVGPWTKKWVNILFRFVTFEQQPNHPGHFEKKLPLSMPVLGLQDIVRQETGICSKDIAIFSDNSRSPESRLDDHNTLEDCGFRGGGEFTPKELLLYYDYRSSESVCPILMSDHYFSDFQDV